MKKTPARCPWVNDDPLVVEYHDTEWGAALHDDARLFEFLVLGGAQAGLSWLTILKRREAYRRAFDGFDPAKVAAYGERRVAALLSDPGIIRNRQKVRAAVANARAFVAVQQEFGSFDRYVWRFVGGRPKVNAWRSRRELPVMTPESDALSRDLVGRGFRFVGSTICYAFMQAAGLVNDHATDCFRYKALAALARARPACTVGRRGPGRKAKEAKA